MKTALWRHITSQMCRQSSKMDPVTAILGLFSRMSLENQHENISVEERAVNAAMQCISEKGAKLCTMELFAKTAGIGRKTIYRAFSNRTELLDRVALKRYELITEKLGAELDTTNSLAQLTEDAIIRTSVLLKEDKVIRSIYETGSYVNFSHYLMDFRSPFQQLVVNFFAPFTDRARENGELREDVTNEEYVGWIRSCQMLIMLNDGISEKRQRDFVRRFVLSGIIL